MKQFEDQYTFSYKSIDGKEVIYKCESNLCAWPELIREFHLFLKGQGFIFDNNKIFVLKKGQYEY